jgi:hypothetical protein
MFPSKRQLPASKPVRVVRRPGIRLLAQAAALVVTAGNPSNFLNSNAYLGAVDIQRIACEHAAQILLEAYGDRGDGVAAMPPAQFTDYISDYKRKCLTVNKHLAF